MTDDDFDYPDRVRTCALWDVGGAGYIATVAIGADGATHMMLANWVDIGSDTVLFDPTCQAVAHEQLGELPAGVSPPNNTRPAVKLKPTIQFEHRSESDDNRLPKRSGPGSEAIADRTRMRTDANTCATNPAPRNSQQTIHQPSSAVCNKEWAAL